MNSFEAYQNYLSFKQHFTIDKYDALKYNFKVKANYSSFEKRNDRYSFEKLSKKRYPKQLLLATLSKDPDMWIGDIVTQAGEDIFLDWKKTHDSLEYTFTQEIKQFENFVEAFKVIDGNYPPALKMLMQNKIHKETIIILNSIAKFTCYWNREIEDTVVWPRIFFNLKKYSSFLDVDVYKYTDIVKNVIHN